MDKNLKNKNTNHYEGQLNIDRIKAYKKLAKEYNISELTVGLIFCKGIDWYIAKLKENV